MPMLKRAVIDGMFADVKGCPSVTASGEGSSKHAAISRAIFNLTHNSRTKGRQWCQLKCSIVIFDVERPDDAKTIRKAAQDNSVSVRCEPEGSGERKKAVRSRQKKVA
jgi:hypothetical protein